LSTYSEDVRICGRAGLDSPAMINRSAGTVRITHSY
jgi:hypothetical protein